MFPVLKVRCTDLNKEENGEHHIYYGEDNIVYYSLHLSFGRIPSPLDGTGNIAGVAGAVAIGGPGAVFWMWCSALLGMATKFAEVTLAVRFRERGADGEWVGGPMYSIKNGLGRRWMWRKIWV